MWSIGAFQNIRGSIHRKDADQRAFRVYFDGRGSLYDLRGNELERHLRLRFEYRMLCEYQLVDRSGVPADLDYLPPLSCGVDYVNCMLIEQIDHDSDGPKGR